MSQPRIPRYRCYKPKNLGLVVIDGRQLYLGRYGSTESLADYHRLIQEWLAKEPGPVGVVRSTGASLIVNDLILAFWTRHAEKHYRRPDGTPTGEIDNYRDSLRPLRRLDGRTPARDFSPLGLKAVRQGLIEGGLSRTTINQRIGRIVRLFKWAASEELVPADVYHALRTVSGLPRGRSAARAPVPVRPALDADVEAIRPQVARQVWAMVELQRLTGMRPGEIVVIRSVDLDMTGEVWVYTPGRHKTEHQGRARTIFLWPRAQGVIQPWLRPDQLEYLFQPCEAMDEYRHAQRLRRTTPLYPSVRTRTEGQPEIRAGRTVLAADILPCGAVWLRTCGCSFVESEPVASRGGDADPRGVQPGAGAGRARTRPGGRDPGLRRARPEEGPRGHGRGRLTCEIVKMVQAVE
jgi:integrase